MIDRLKNAVDNTVEQFQKYATSFLSERDIQAWLFVELRNATVEHWNNYPAGGVNSRFGFRDPFRIRPITTEYYLYKGERDRFDIAVLSAEQDPDSALWRQPCRIAIEIKLWQPGYGEPGYRSDIKKLEEYQNYMQNNFIPTRPFTGVSMLFVHPYAKTGPTAILDERSGDDYPENGVAWHVITEGGHWWKQMPPPSIPDFVV